MQNVTVSCACGRQMTLDSVRGRGAYRCGCGTRIRIEEDKVPDIRCVGTTQAQTPCRFSVATTEPLPLCRVHFVSTGLKQYKDWCQLGSDEVGMVGALREVAWQRLVSGADQYTPASNADLGDAGISFLSAQDWKPPASTLECPTVRGEKVVYFIRIGELVKIGKSHDLKKRLCQYSYPFLELLATEPGYTKRERQLHIRFRALRVSGEWFRYEAPLREYVEKLQARRAENGADVPAWRS